MITEQPHFDLTLLADNFTTCGDYTKKVILEEFSYWQKQPDFLCLVSENDGSVDGFLIGYRNRNSLWIAQVWRKNDSSWTISRDGMAMAKEWAKQRGMTSLSGETKRSEKFALERYSFEEFSVNLICKL